MDSKLLQQIDNNLKKNLKPKRYQHVLGVEETALFIGKHYNLDLTKISLAAKLHDYAKYLSLRELVEYCQKRTIEMDSFEINNHGLLHGKVGRYMAEEIFNIHDEEILNSISSHTTGRRNMSIYEEIIFVSDYCDPNRQLDHCDDILNLAIEDLKKAVFHVVSSKILYVIKMKGELHPRSIEVYNNYLCKIK